MDIVFKESAFWHDIKEADIRQAFMNPHYDGPIEDTDEGNRYIRIGFDRAGNFVTIQL